MKINDNSSLAIIGTEFVSTKKTIIFNLNTNINKLLSENIGE